MSKAVRDIPDELREVFRNVAAWGTYTQKDFEAIEAYIKKRELKAYSAGETFARTELTKRFNEIIEDFVSELVSYDSVLNDKALMNTILEYPDEARAKWQEGK